MTMKMPEFDRYGRYVEDPCYGCEAESCAECPREDKMRRRSEYWY